MLTRILPASGRPPIIKAALQILYLYSGYVWLRDCLLSWFGRSRAVILCYHRIGPCDALSKPVEAFRRDLEYLRGRYRYMPLRTLCEQLQANAPLRRRSVVITFDDGYRDNYLAALPVLEDAGAPAVFFVATGFIGAARTFPHDAAAAGARHANLTWDDLRDMQAKGFEIGSHTINHANCSRLDASTLRQELAGSLEVLNRELGARPRAFAFPWGKPGDIPAGAGAALKELGYYAAASAYGGMNGRGACCCALRRIDAGNGNLSPLAFKARVAGWDPELWRLTWKRWLQLAAQATKIGFLKAGRGTDGRGSLGDSTVRGLGSR